MLTILAASEISVPVGTGTLAWSPVEVVKETVWSAMAILAAFAANSTPVL
jgi:hypothetical protein